MLNFDFSIFTNKNYFAKIDVKTTLHKLLYPTKALQTCNFWDKKMNNKSITRKNEVIASTVKSIVENQ
jgi:hypothetical protein